MKLLKVIFFSDSDHELEKDGFWKIWWSGDLKKPMELQWKLRRWRHRQWDSSDVFAEKKAYYGTSGVSVPIAQRRSIHVVASIHPPR